MPADDASAAERNAIQTNIALLEVDVSCMLPESALSVIGFIMSVPFRKTFVVHLITCLLFVLPDTSLCPMFKSFYHRDAGTVRGRRSETLPR